MAIGNPKTPSAVKIIDIENHKLKLDYLMLDELLLREDLKDHYVVVISIAGAFRKGKSFLLNFFLRYLNEVYTLNKNENDWMGREDEELKGFLWKGGAKRVTDGILMWNHIFTTKLENGKKVAIILLDTQGTFDNESTIKECTAIFAASTLLSSVQIYNLSQNIQRDDLEHLAFFTRYGSQVLDRCDEKPFQKLMFLIRDWQYGYEHNFGLDGGKDLLNNKLGPKEKDSQELISIKNNINCCFESIECFLMPDPGKQVKSIENFRGKLSEIEDDFKFHLNELIRNLLKKNKLVIKEMYGKQLKVPEFVKYFKSTLKVFESDILPEPKSILNANAETQLNSLLEECKNFYNKQMKLLCENQYQEQTKLKEKHDEYLKEVLNMFRSRPKLADKPLVDQYIEILIKVLEELFRKFVLENDKNQPINVVDIAVNTVLGAVTVVGLVTTKFSPVVGACISSVSAVALGIYNLAKKMKEEGQKKLTYNNDKKELKDDKSIKKNQINNIFNNLFL